MPIITAEEFKSRMWSSGIVSNVQVNQDINYSLADSGNVPRNMTITNCELKTFKVSRNQIDSLTFNKGAIGELRIHKESVIQNLTVNQTNISSIELVETNVEKFDLNPGRQQKASLTGGMASIREILIAGDLQMIRLNRLQCDLFSITGCRLEVFNLYNISVTNVMLNNVTCPTCILLDYEVWRPDRLNATNLKADLKIKIERTKEFSLTRPVKAFEFAISRS